MIITNAFVRVTKLDGTLRYARRRVQWDDALVNERLQTGHAPTLHKVLYDLPRTLYERGDIITVTELDGQAVTTLPPKPLHAWRVQAPGGPLAATEVALVRLDILLQTGIWWEAITREQAVAGSPGYDPIRSLPTVRSDGSHGRGWDTGYFTGKPSVFGILEQKNLQEVRASGLVVYENAFVFWEPPLNFNKFDVLQLTDGRRGEIGDVVSVHQQHGVTFATMAMLNLHRADSEIYKIA